MNVFGTALKILITNPKKLLLIDAMGALLTAFCMCIVLPQLKEIFGIPQYILLVLGSIAFFYSILSVLFSRINSGKSKNFLRIMGTFNLIYCCITAGLLYNLATITILGIGYFSIEGLIIIALAVMEFNAASADHNANDRGTEQSGSLRG